MPEELVPLNQMAAPVDSTTLSSNRLRTRLIVGLLQGLFLYVLLNVSSTGHWPTTHALLFAPLLLIGLLVPPTVIVGIGHLTARRQMLWSVLLAVAVGVLGYSDGWRGMDAGLFPVFGHQPPHAPMPSIQVSFFSGVFVFIAYTLILAGETTRRRFASYEAYFECSWKLALQIILSLLFVGVFFLVLWTGASLFLLLKLTFLQRLMIESWFRTPVSAIVFAASLHLTDVRPDFIRGIRTLLLTLKSWLLPLLVLIVVGFLLSLLVAGVAPLWATRTAAQLLLSVAALDIVLINAAFKSGDTAEMVPRVLGIATRVACVMLLPVVALAAYALSLRVAQYGLTVDRIFAIACLLVAAFYAIGYAWAALTPHVWLRRIAPTNIFTAFVTLVVIAALFTPVADPARLAVASQVNRLLTGQVTPDKFDFNFLRKESGIYGRTALARLQSDATGPNATSIRQLSAQENTFAGPQPPAEEVRLTAAELAHNITSRTPGKEVPASFFSNDWRRAKNPEAILPSCLTDAGAQCDAYLVDLTGAGTHNVLLFAVERLKRAAGSQTYGAGEAYGQDEAGVWHEIAQFSIGPDCTAVREALAQGNYQRVPPLLPDLIVGGQRVHLQPLTATPGWTCSRSP
jgi:hypothetical protein